MASIAPQREFSDKQRKKLAGTGAAMPDGSFPIKSEQDLSAHSVLIPDGEAPPEWIELLPAGRFQGNDGRGPYTLEDAESVIAASNAARGLPIDFNHATDYGSPLGLPAPAAGWIRELAVRDGAIHGRVEWTEKGAAAIAAKEYRFISPVFTHTKEGLVLAIQRAGLTNNPNLNLTAVAAARTTMAGENDGGAEMSLSKIIAGLEKVFPNLPPERLLEIAKSAMADGDADADGMDAQDAADGDPYGESTDTADAMRARHATEMAQCAEEDRPAMEAKHAKERQAYESRHAATAAQSQLSESQVTAMVAKHPLMVKTQRQLSDLLAERAREKAEIAVNAAVKAGKIIPAQREWAMSYALSDPAGFTTYIGTQPAVFGADGSFAGTPPTDPNNPTLANPELAVCAVLGLAPADFTKAKTAAAARKAGEAALRAVSA